MTPYEKNTKLVRVSQGIFRNSNMDRLFQSGNDSGLVTVQNASLWREVGIGFSGYMVHTIKKGLAN